MHDSQQYSEVVQHRALANLQHTMPAASGASVCLLVQTDGTHAMAVHLPLRTCQAVDCIEQLHNIDKTERRQAHDAQR